MSTQTDSIHCNLCDARCIRVENSRQFRPYHLTPQMVCPRCTMGDAVEAMQSGTFNAHAASRTRQRAGL